MNVSIQTWTKSDICIIAEIERQCIKNPWNENMLAEEYLNPDFNCLVAKQGEILTGYINYHTVLDEYHISNIAVDKNYRRKGIASALLLYLFEIAMQNSIKGITLEVGKYNNSAIELYTKHGFKAEGIRKKYYGDEDAVIMWKYLNK